MTNQELITLLDRAIESIGSFCSDQGWATSDMETLDDLIAARAIAAQPAAQEQVKPEFASFVDTPQKRFLYDWGRRDGYQDGYASALAEAKAQPAAQEPR